MNTTKKLICGTLILTLTTVAVSGFSMYFSAFLARSIGAEAMGIFSLLSSVYMFAITLATSGIGLATTKLVAEEVALGRAGAVKRVVRRCLVYALVASVSAGILLVLGAEFIGVNLLHSAYTVRPLRVLAISLPLLATSAVFSGYFLAMGQVVRNAAGQIIEQGVRVLICMQILAYFLANYGIEGACLAIVLSGLVSEGVAFGYRAVAYWSGRRGATGSLPQGVTRRLLNLALPLALSSYLRSALSTAKHVMMPIFLAKSGMAASSAIAEYGVIHGMVIPLLLFPACFLNAATNLLIPEIAQLRVLQNRAKIGRAVAKVFRVALVYSIAVCGIFFFFAEPLALAVFNNAEAGRYIRLLAFSVPIIYFDNIVDGLLKGLDRQVRVMQINIIDSIAVIAMIMLILPRFGIMGFIVVFYLSEILNVVMSVVCLLRTTACSFKFREWLVRPIIAIVAAVIVMGMMGEIGLVMGILVILGIYGGINFCLTRKPF